MPRVNLPAGCAGFADGDKKYLAVNGPGSYVNLDEDRDANALRKLKNQDYAVAGLVDAGPQKEFIRGSKKNGRWCGTCLFLGHSWMKQCSKCGGDTVPEDEMVMPPPPKNHFGSIIILSGVVMWKDFMSAKRKPRNNSNNQVAMQDFRDFRFGCFIDTAVNPVTNNQVTLVQPVVIKCYEDFAKFYDQWEDFCRNSLTGDPGEVAFSLST